MMFIILYYSTQKPKIPHSGPKIEADSQFAYSGADSRADLCWLLLTSAGLVLWAYRFGPALRAT